VIRRRDIVGLTLTLLGILTSAAVLYYMGKAGFEWGKNIDEDETDSK
jgi:hypothetical protein